MNSLPKLIFVVTTPFAANVFLRNHLLRLSKNYNVTLCTNTQAYVLDKEIQETVNLVHVDIKRDINVSGDLVALCQLIKCFLILRPVLLHTMTPKAGLLAQLAGWITFVPFRIHAYTGQVWVHKNGWMRFLLKNIDKIIAILSNNLMADSASQCKFLINQGVIKGRDIKVLGMGSIAGVDKNKFRPDSIVRNKLREVCRVGIDDVIFLFVGRITRDKGVLDLINVFQSLGIKYKNWHLWIVGPDEEGIICGMSTQLSRSKNIQWFGATRQPELYMAASDILVLPSVREGFGSVIIEAAACGLPTVACKIDGIIDAVVNGETGVLIEGGNLKELSNALENLASNKNLAVEMGRKACARAVEKFDSEKITTEWECLFKSILRKM